MSATPSKRTHDGQVKIEGQAVDAIDAVHNLLLAPSPPPPPALRASPAWDTRKTRARGDKLRDAIQEFLSVFIVDGVEQVPFVLHFTIAEWIVGFTTTLRNLGVIESAINQQIEVTLTLGLARWVKNVIRSKCAKEMSMSHRWLLGPYVQEAVSMGYLEDKAIETIIKIMGNLSAA